jgi:hypothetical protein
MRKFFIYYRKNPTFRPYGGFQGENRIIAFFNPQDGCIEISDEYAFVAMQWGEDMGDVWHTMQGEIWSPNGEARDLIRGLGLQHTSMSVGDLIVDDEGCVFEVANVGFKEIPLR